MRFWISFLAVVVAIFVATNAFAQDSCAAKQGTCTQSKQAQLVSDEGKQCDKPCAQTCTKGDAAACAKKCDEKTLAAMPAMRYKVGDELLCCPKGAEKLAAEKSQKVIFVVDKQEFESEGDAAQAYRKVLDDYLAGMTTVKYVVGDKSTCCAETAATMAKAQNSTVKYQLATYTFDDKAQAEKGAMAAKKAAEQVAMTWSVDGKNYTCPKTAEQACNGNGKKVEYCVGEFKTQCEVTAQVELTKSRILAAARAIAELQGA